MVVVLGTDFTVLKRRENICGIERETERTEDVRIIGLCVVLG